MAAGAPVISYEKPPDRTGVSVERDARHVTIIVPPLPTWRLLSRGIIVGCIALTAIVLAWIGALVNSLIHGDGGLLPGMLSNVACYGIALLGVLLLAYARLHRWTTFTVTADRLLLNMRTASRGGRTTSWPRGRIGQVRALTDRGKISIQIISEDLLEVFVSPKESEIRLVARTLDEALATKLEPSQAVSSPAPARPVVPRRARKWRPVEIAVAMVGAVIFMASIYIPALFFVMVVAAIPLGLWFGTQDKEYYL
jgi:hypothetical protein